MFSEQLVLFDSLGFLMFPDAASTAPKIAPSHSKDLNSMENSRVNYLQWIISISRDINYNPVREEEFRRDWAEQHRANTEINASQFASAQNSLLSIRIYGVYQTIMKLHPLFDLAITEV
jgi:hypothetical protein